MIFINILTHVALDRLLIIELYLTIMNQIAHKLKSKMKDNKLTMQALADKSGVPFSSIKSIIQGRSKSPRGNTLQALAEAFDCDISDFTNSETSAEPSVEIIEVLPTVDKISLFKEAINVFDAVAKENNVSFKENHHLRDKCINQLFDFAIEKLETHNSLPTIDRSFAQWLISNSQKS